VVCLTYSKYSSLPSQKVFDHPSKKAKNSTDRKLTRCLELRYLLLAQMTPVEDQGVNEELYQGGGPAIQDLSSTSFILAEF
jgi:hypothetical protein